MAKSRIVGIGALNIDRIFTVGRISAGGETYVEAAGSFPGGSAANTIYGLGKLGISTGFCGAVADDDNGRILLDDFVCVGTDTSHVVIKRGQESGSTFCMTDGKERTLYVMSGANGKLSFEDVDTDYLDNSEWLHLSSFVDDAQFIVSQNIVKKLPGHVKLSFSPGALYVERGLAELNSIFKRTEILFLNQAEIEQLTKRSFDEGARICLEAGCKFIVVTFSGGIYIENNLYIAYICGGGRAIWITPGSIEVKPVVDSTGAGDAFAAGYLFGKLSGKTGLTCGRYGHIAAALTLRFCGARLGLPSEEELIKHYSSFYPDSASKS